MEDNNNPLTEYQKELEKIVNFNLRNEIIGLIIGLLFFFGILGVFVWYFFNEFSSFTVIGLMEILCGGIYIIFVGGIFFCLIKYCVLPGILNLFKYYKLNQEYLNNPEQFRIDFEVSYIAQHPENVEDGKIIDSSVNKVDLTKKEDKTEKVDLKKKD